MKKKLTHDEEVRQWYLKRGGVKRIRYNKKRNWFDVFESKYRRFGKTQKKGEIVEKKINTILTYREQGMRFADIAKELNVTRQRIDQIVKLYFSPEELGYAYMFRPKYTHTKFPKQEERRVCPHCKDEFVVLMKSTKKYCSRLCARRAMLVHKEAPHALSKLERNTWLYRNDPNYRDLHRQRLHKQWLRNKADPVWYARYNARQAILHQRHVEKQKYGHAITPLPPLEPMKRYKFKAI